VLRTRSGLDIDARKKLGIAFFDFREKAVRRATPWPPPVRRGFSTLRPATRKRGFFYCFFSSSGGRGHQELVPLPVVPERLMSIRREDYGVTPKWRLSG